MYKERNINFVKKKINVFIPWYKYILVYEKKKIKKIKESVKELEVGNLKI